MRKLMLALAGVLAFGILSPASANGKDCDCDTVLKTTKRSQVIVWKSFPPQMIAKTCPIFADIEDGLEVEAMCQGTYTRCVGSAGVAPRLCEVRVVDERLRVRTTEREVGIDHEVPTTRERVITREVPVTRERTIVRHRHVERERDTGGSWYPISHRSTMNCWGRGSVPRGKAVFGQCNGVYTKCIGGSLDSGAHRQCWARR